MTPPYRKLFNNSFQRVVVNDPNRFYKRFYDNLVAADIRIAKLFLTTDTDGQIEKLTQSVTYMMSFSATLEPDDEIERLAKVHGKNSLNIPTDFYDTWLNCMIETLEEFDPKFDEYIETSWRVMMAPGIAYMKTFCSH